MKKKFFSLFIVLSCLLLLSFIIAPSTQAEGTTVNKPQSKGISWPKNQALPSFSKPKNLDVVNLNNASGDTKIMMTTLQGLVNRTRPRIYLIEGNPQEGNDTWLKNLNVPYTVYQNVWDLIEKYRHDVKGLIVYDPNQTASINVATTMAGIQNGLVVSPEIAKKLTEKPYQLPILTDLRGKFTSSSEAYNWEYENLWPKVNHRMLIGLSPTQSIDVPSNNWDNFTTLLQENNEVRDSSNRNIYNLDLSKYLGGNSVYLRFQDSFPSDGWGPAVYHVTVKADGNVIADFVPGTEGENPYLYDHGGSQVAGSGDSERRFSDGGSYFVYQFTPPKNTKNLSVSIDMENEFKISASDVQPISSDAQTPYGYLRDYAVANRAMVFWLEPNVPEDRTLFEKILSNVKPGTPYLGWYPNDVSGEFSGTQLTSEHGVITLASDWFNNMTVFSGTKAQMKKPVDLPVPKLENKIYVTFTMSEGDNLQYVEHRMRQNWADKGRGSVPINWTIDPLIYDAAPNMLSYFQQTATKNDLLIAGPSGAGYIYPNDWPDSSFNTYLNMTKDYLNKTKMNSVYILNRVDGQDVSLSEQKAKAYESLGLDGIFLNWENDSESSILGKTLPQSVIMGGGNVEGTIDQINQAAASWDGNSPKFISVGILGFNFSPTDVDQIANSLGSKYEVVRGDQFFKLMKEANK